MQQAEVGSEGPLGEQLGEQGTNTVDYFGQQGRAFDEFGFGDLTLPQSGPDVGTEIVST